MLALVKRLLMAVFTLMRLISLLKNRSWEVELGDDGVNGCTR